MTKSREQLINRALQKLGVIGAGQVASAEDAKLLSDEIAPVMADLASRNIYVWGDPDQIEDAPFVHLAEILANAVARDFGRAPDEAVRLMAESRLRELQVEVLSGQPQWTEYF